MKVGEDFPSSRLDGFFLKLQLSVHDIFLVLSVLVNFADVLSFHQEYADSGGEVFLRGHPDLAIHLAPFEHTHGTRLHLRKNTHPEREGVYEPGFDLHDFVVWSFVKCGSDAEVYPGRQGLSLSSESSGYAGSIPRRRLSSSAAGEDM